MTQRLLRTLTLFLMVTATIADASRRSTVELSTADQRCFFSAPSELSDPPALRSCRTCLNANQAIAPCFLDARGLCLSMDSYDATRDADGFVAANTTYCADSDETCEACLLTNPASGVCTGREGQCVCLSVCESATWETDARAAVRVASGASPSVISAPVTEAPRTPVSVVLFGIVACALAVAVVVISLRRRCTPKPAQPVTGYNLVLTPTAKLPPKTLSGRV